MTTTTLEPVTAKTLTAFRSLYNLYLHDLAAYLPDLNVDESGSYDAKVVDELVDHADRGVNLFLIRCDDRIAGMLVHSGPPLVKDGNDFHLHELFVLNQFKGSGVAVDAVRALSAVYPGRYGFSVLASNARALAFWDRLLATIGRDVKCTSDGSGLVAFSFMVRGADDA